MKNLTKGNFRDTLVMIGIIGGVYLSVKYLLPLIIPFLIASAIMLLINPVIGFIHKKIRLNPGIIAGIFVIVAAAGGVFGLWILFGKLFLQIKNLIENLDFYTVYIYDAISQWCFKLEGSLGIKAAVLEENILVNIDKLLKSIEEQWAMGLMNHSFPVIKGLVEFVGTGVFTIILIILLAKDGKELKEKSKKYPYYKEIRKIGKKILQMGGTYLRAQLTIMIIVGIICVICLLILRNPYALLFGLGIGLLDALPVFGTGSILIPWGIAKIMQGEFAQAAILGTTYLITSLLREYLEPKLIGEKIGVSSVGVIMSIYIGIQVYGIMGFFLGPLSLLLIMEIWKELQREDTIITDSA